MASRRGNLAEADRDKIARKHETILDACDVFEVKNLGPLIIACTVFLLVVHAFWADWLWRYNLVDLRERVGRWQINSRLALLGGLIAINGVSLLVFWPGIPLEAAQVNAVYHLLLAADEARRIFPRPRANAPRGVFLVNHLMWSALSWMWIAAASS
jgi:hypothetical protein